MVTFFISILYAYLISIRNYVNDKYITNYQSSELKLPAINKLLVTLYYAALAITSYIVMFSLMSVSFWVAISLIIGNSIGFYFFNLKKENKIGNLYENLNQ